MAVYVNLPNGKQIHLTILWGRENPAFERAFDVNDLTTNAHLVQANSVNTSAFTPTTNGQVIWTWRAPIDTKLQLYASFKRQAGDPFFEADYESLTINIASGSFDATSRTHGLDKIYTVANVSWLIQD